MYRKQQATNNAHVNEGAKENVITGGDGGGIVVLEETEDVEMKAPELPMSKGKDAPKVPNIPAPSPSVSSTASSNVINP